MRSNVIYPDSLDETKSMGSYLSHESMRSFQEIVRNNARDSSFHRILKYWRMILIILIPVLALLYLTTNSLLKASEVKKSTVSAITEVTSAKKLANLIQMLQRERGISATFLSANGNRSQASEAMFAARENTDLAFVDVQEHGNTVEMNGTTYTMSMLRESVYFARERIGNNSVLVEDHLNFYTDLNNLLMNSMFGDINISKDQNHFVDIVAFSSILRWTDIIGLLRARIAFQYATCDFDTKTLQNYMFLSGQAVAYKIVFTSYSSLMKDAFSKQEQSTEEYLNEVKNSAWDDLFRKHCVSLSKEDRLSLGLLWFKNITKFIDFAFDVKQRQSEIITTKMLERKSQAAYDFNLYLSVQIVATILSFVLTTWYIICIDKLTFKIAKHALTIKSQSRELLVEKRLSEKLLFQMLPRNIATALKETGEVTAECFQEVTILFSDIVNFTEMGSRSTPMQIIDLLNDLYGLFDDHIEKYDVYKVETIGDAYMVASGVPVLNGNAHASHICNLALDLQQLMKEYRVPGSFQRKEQVKIRIGIHSGPCVAGIVGRKMPRYCLFGDTVNTASRMESTGQGGRIHLSSDTYKLIKQTGIFTTVLRGVVTVKGKGEMTTYWLISSCQSSQVKIREKVQAENSGKTRGGVQFI
eukprot:XP_011412980.1 PREDICTED: uncharacterized protein LOC105317877 [Crassostrea gigas]